MICCLSVILSMEAVGESVLFTLIYFVYLLLASADFCAVCMFNGVLRDLLWNTSLVNSGLDELK